MSDKRKIIVPEKKELCRLSLPLDIKSISEKGEFEGYASTFDNVDFGDDVVVKGAFQKSLAEWKAKNQLPMMLLFHSMRMGVGDWLKMHEDTIGLFVKGQLWLGDKAIPDSIKAHNMLTGTGPKGLSIGFFANKVSFGEKDGRREVRFLEEVELVETSIVPFGMNDKAVITQAKSVTFEHIPDAKTIEGILRDAGFSHDTAKTLMAKGYAGLREGGKNDGDLLARLNNLAKQINPVKGDQ